MFRLLIKFIRSFKLLSNLLKSLFKYMVFLLILPACAVSLESNSNFLLKTTELVPTTSSINTVNRIAVFVNKGVITSNQINRQIQQVMKSFTTRGAKPPDIKDIKNKVIEQLVLEQIQLDLAAKSGIRSNDIEITEAINNIAKSQKMTLDGLKSSLAKDGISYEAFRHQIEVQIILDKLKQRDVDARVVVNDDEINRVLNSEAYKTRVDYHLSMIMITIPEEASNDVISQRYHIATMAYNELTSGVSFDRVALKYSNAPNALTGGDLGWRNSAVLPPNIAAALSTLSVGGYTDVIKLPVGFFIFKINEVKKHGTTQIIKQYHVRHILIKVNEITSDDEAHQKILNIYDKLETFRNNKESLAEEFIKYAKQYSEDSSSINGGDIGWVSKGDTVPAFESVIMATPVGVISHPVRTIFGWHILQILGLRESNLTSDREKATIRQELRENKSTILYTEWLRDIRDSAYVKFNDE